jgi:hypothetical protein
MGYEVVGKARLGLVSLGETGRGRKGYLHLTCMPMCLEEVA